MKLRIALTLSIASLACGPEDAGVVAHLEFPDEAYSAAELRTRSQGQVVGLPSVVSRLDVSALGEDDVELAAVALATTPTMDELPLSRTGGVWTLRGVPPGVVTIRAVASLGMVGDPALDNRRAFSGEVENVRVRAGQTADVGVVPLQMLPGIRIPQLDTRPPGAPEPVTLEPVPAGGALVVGYMNPGDSDIGGYVVAMTALAIPAPFIPRRTDDLRPGRLLAPGVEVVAVHEGIQPTFTRVEDLRDGTSYSFFVYAFDVDQEAEPLNYSPAAVGVGFPRDTLPPGAPVSLSIAPEGVDSAVITFLAPGEDGPVGDAPVFELRASQNPSDFAPERFEALPPVPPPTASRAGETVQFTRTLTQLGMTGQPTFTIGLRGRDAAMNVGPIATAVYRR